MLLFQEGPGSAPRTHIRQLQQYGTLVLGDQISSFGLHKQFMHMVHMQRGRNNTNKFIKTRKFLKFCFPTYFQQQKFCPMTISCLKDPQPKFLMNFIHEKDKRFPYLADWIYKGVSNPGKKTGNHRSFPGVAKQNNTSVHCKCVAMVGLIKKKLTFSS